MYSAHHDIMVWHRIEGWANLSEFLGSIGIPKSVASLEALHRRHGLPCHGGGRQGKGVYFTRDDQCGWVRFFTGVDLDTWILQIEKDRAAGVEGELDRVRPAARSTSDIELLLAPLIVAITRPPAGCETVHRLPSGYTYASTNECVAEVWGGSDEFTFPVRIWRYAKCRLAKEVELRPRQPQHRQRRSKEATTLIAAVEIKNSRAKLCRIPGEVFGLAEGTETALVVSPNEPSFSEVIEHGQKEFPDAVWFRWSRRVPLKLITLEEDLPDEDDFLADVLG